jgi:hypothetical protein
MSRSILKNGSRSINLSVLKNGSRNDRRVLRRLEYMIMSLVFISVNI